MDDIKDRGHLLINFFSIQLNFHRRSYRTTQTLRHDDQFAADAIEAIDESHSSKKTQIKKGLAVCFGV
jgi:hypothetical protein